MYFAMNHITVPEDKRERFEEMFKTRARAVDKRPGFIKFYCLKPESGDTYIIMTLWENKKAFEEWANGSPEFKDGHKRAPELSETPPPITSDMKGYFLIAE